MKRYTINGSVMTYTMVLSALPDADELSLRSLVIGGVMLSDSGVMIKRIS